MKSGQVNPRSIEVPPTEVWFELRKILRSKQLRSCPSLRRLLCFLVDEAIAGRGNRLTEYVIGVQVFKRPAGFDPRLDSRVRVEAFRLRKTLAEYYRQLGRCDPILVELVPGCYVPSFRYRQ